ncbi:26S protease regulatory subunit 7 [Capsicum baccatum]|uniref:26S protease regulatory subunit 7 n=1 Tax=Capsicum baccatum TaxID=33114 RepID=A0A2G2X9C8_CAPBA|nr:26S protease regulatory subunit 7 [Capsicum baccatum]
MWVDISIVDGLIQPLVDKAMLSGYSCREEWNPAMGVLCYGPPGTGKTLLARAAANRTDTCFIHIIGSELVQKYVSERARMPSVDIKTVFAHMMNRFSNYTALSAEVSAKNQTSLQEDNTFWFLNNFFSYDDGHCYACPSVGVGDRDF